MTESSDKAILILTESNWSKWSAMAKIKFKMIKAWTMIEEKKKLSDYDDDTAKQEKYRELALKVNLILMSGTEGHDNEIVTAQDAEDISSAWYKLVEKHEGNQDEVLLRTFDAIALESFKEMKDTNIYVERYLNWATVIKQKAESIENLVKLIITTNMFRTLPKEFESVKERIRADLDDYDLKDIADAVKTRAREILKDEKYNEQFGNLKRSSSEEEINKINAQLNQIGWKSGGRNWSGAGGYSGHWSGGYNNFNGRGQYGAGQRGYSGGRGFRPYRSRPWNGNWYNKSNRGGLNNINQEDEHTNSSNERDEPSSGGSVTENRPKKFVATVNAIGQNEQKTSNLKEKKYVGRISSIIDVKVKNEPTEKQLKPKKVIGMIAGIAMSTPKIEQHLPGAAAEQTVKIDQHSLNADVESTAETEHHRMSATIEQTAEIEQHRLSAALESPIAEEKSEVQSKIEKAAQKPKKILGKLSAINKHHNYDENTIIIDSGAKPVAFKNKELLTDVKCRLEENEYVVLANGQEVRVHGSGKLILTSNKHTIELDDVLWVPELQVNYLSVYRLAQIGLKTSFEGNYSVISFKDKNLLWADWAEFGYSLLYDLNKKKKHARSDFESDYKCSQEKMINNLTIGEEDKSKLYEEWHDRLSHPGIEMQNAVMRLMGLPTAREFKCESCVRAKMARKAHPPSETYTTRPFQRIHSDLMGPIPYKSKKIHILTIKDDFSRYTNVYILNSKEAGPVKEHLARYIDWNTKRTGHGLTEFKSDNGLEFMSNEIDQLLREKNVRRCNSSPGVPQQNGKAESFNRQLMQIVRAIMIHAGVEDNDRYLLDAIAFANNIANQIPKKCLDLKCPEEIFLGKRPRYQNLHPFLCKVEVFNRSVVGKTKAKSFEAVNLGPLPLGKGCRYERTDQNRSRNESPYVEYFDNVYPLRKQKVRSESAQTKPNDRYAAVDWPESENNNANNTNNNNNSSDMNNNSNAEQRASDEHEQGEQGESKNQQSSDLNEQAQSDYDEEYDEEESTEDEEDEFNYEEIVKLDLNERIVEIDFEEAVNGLESDDWIRAIEEELETFEEHQAFEEPLVLDVSLSESNLVDSRWVFVKKFDADGNISRYRARLVARGFNIQVEAARKYAPTISKQQLRLLLAEAVRNGHDVHQIDVRTAYLYSDLLDEIFLQVPAGYQPKQLPCTILKIKKAMYGLPQSGRLWYEHLKATLNDMGFENLKNDEAIFTNGKLKLAIYVDDLLIIGQLDDIEAFKNEFKEHYQIRDGGELNYFLGTEYQVIRSGSIYKIGMSNRAKIHQLIEKFRQENAKAQSVPCIYQKAQLKSQPIDPTLVEEKLIRSIVGSLRFIESSTHPEIAYALSIVAAQQETPVWGVMRQALKILAYLKSHIDQQLWIEAIEGPVVEVFADASYKGIFDQSASRAGCAIYYAGCLIFWSTAKLGKKTKSPGESELLAAIEQTEQVELIENTLDELGVTRKQTKLYVDSKTVVDCVENPTNKSKMVHRRGEIELMKEFAEERELIWVESKENRADALTKPLGPSPFETAKFNLNIYKNE